MNRLQVFFARMEESMLNPLQQMQFQLILQSLPRVERERACALVRQFADMLRATTDDLNNRGLP